jgi:hypothetical protein
MVLRSESAISLSARQDKADGHVTIYPNRDMTFEEYQEKLNGIKWKKKASSLDEV